MVDARELAVDESKRTEDHEEIKSRLREQVHEEIEKTPSEDATADRSEVRAVARALKSKALSDVVETEEELAWARKIAALKPFVDYVFYLVYGMVGLMIVLELLGAREGSGFKQFLNTVTAPLLAPFKGLMPDPAVGSFQLMLSYVIALLVYVLVHWALSGLLRLLATRPRTI